MERRKDPRLPLKIRAQVSTSPDFANSIEAEILDISRSGAFVHCLMPIEIGQQIFVRVHFDELQVLSGTVIPLGQLRQMKPKDRETRSQSQIRWVRGSQQSGFGMRFMNMDASQRAFVDRVHDRLMEEEAGLAQVNFTSAASGDQ